jgi:hypothetical protein
MKTKVLITVNETDIVSVVANGNTEVFLKHTNESHQTTAARKLETVETTNEQFERMIVLPKVTAEEHGKFPKGRWVTVALLFMLALPCCAMPVLDAIAQVESGNCDTCVGPSGEVSRYQFMSRVWLSVTHLPLSAAVNPVTASNAANQELGARIARFTRSHHCAPTIFQQALLWRCLARVDRPTAADKDYAQRVVNLASIQ